MFELLLVVVALLALLAVLASPRRPGRRDPAVKPIASRSLPAFERQASLFVTPSEKAFFQALRRELPPAFHLHAKVRLEDVIGVRREVARDVRWKLRGRVKSRHLDYLVSDLEGVPLLAVELDGASHAATGVSDEVKTTLCRSVDLPLLRVHVGEDFRSRARKIVRDLKRG